MKLNKILLIVIMLCCIKISYTQTYIPQDYKELFKCEKQIDAINCNFNIYYKMSIGRLDFMVETPNTKINGEYKIFIFNLYLGEKFLEKYIPPDSFYQDLPPGIYSIKIVNKTTNFSRIIKIT